MYFVYFQYGHARLETGSGLAGCYATHIILQAGTSVVQIPDTVTDKMAASVNCALATMVNAVYSITHEHVENKVALVQVIFIYHHVFVFVCFFML